MNPAILTQVSKITDQIYLCGAFALERTPVVDSEYILCCIPHMYVAEIHKKLLRNKPSLTILYLPYDDDHNQNLWKNNFNLIGMLHPGSGKGLFDSFQNKPLIEVGYNFMDEAIKNNGKVLVHCMAGVSRSASLVIYYLMKKNHMSYAEAYQIVKTRRPIIQPNDSFQLQLINYEKLREQFTEDHANEITKKVTLKS